MAIIIMDLHFLILSICLVAAAEVNLLPRQLVSVPNGNVSFLCASFAETITGIEWLLNSTLLDNLNLTDVRPVFSVTSDLGRVGRLIFSRIPIKYNFTNITCRAELNNGQVEITSSHLIIQGTLAAVGSLTISFEEIITCLNWTAPFTLDIPTTDPDITYCVDVINSTSSVTLHSQCGINVTVFDYPTPSNSECGGVLFTVTPENAAGRGEPNSITYSQAFVPPKLMEGNQVNPGSIRILENDFSHIVYTMNMTAPVCSAHMMLVDIHTQEEFTLSQEDIIIKGATVVFTSERLPLNRRYSVVITATNANGTALSNVDEISTHDVLTASIYHNGQTVQVQYLENTRARGSLVLLMLISSGKVDFSKSLYLALDRQSSRDYTLPSPLLAEWYIISIYDIEENGTVQGHIAYPAFSQNHFVMRNTPGFTIIPTATPDQTVSASGLQDCNVTSSQDLVISVLCTPSPESLVTGYLVLVQRNILDNFQVSQLHVNESSDHTHAVTVVVEEGGDYHVTVFPMYEDTGIVGNSVAYSESLSLSTEFKIALTPPDYEVNPNTNTTIITGVGAAVGGIVLVAVIVILVIVCRKIIKTKSKKIQLPKGTTSPKGEAIVYEEIGEVVKETFMFTRNALYGVSSPTGMDERQLQEKGITTVSETPQVRNQEYEDVDVPKSTGGGKEREVSAAGQAYQMEECSAYGANN